MGRIADKTTKQVTEKYNASLESHLTEVVNAKMCMDQRATTDYGSTLDDYASKCKVPAHADDYEAFCQRSTPLPMKAFSEKGTPWMSDDEDRREWQELVDIYQANMNFDSGKPLEDTIMIKQAFVEHIEDIRENGYPTSQNPAEKARRK